MNKEIVFKKYMKRGPDYHYRQIYKRHIGLFNAYVYARHQILLELIKRILKENIKKEIKVLDVGCGDGVFIYLFKKKIKNRNIQLIGIDNSEIALKVATQKNPEATFKKSNVYELPFSDNYFDLIISSDVIEHISEPKKMLSEMKRVGKNYSNVIIGTPIRHREVPYDKMHYHEFFPKEFENLLNDYFSNIKLIKSHKLLYFFLYFKNSALLRKKRPFFRYLINILTIFFKINPFLKVKTTKNDLQGYSYMFAYSKIEK